MQTNKMFLKLSNAIVIDVKHDYIYYLVKIAKIGNLHEQFSQNKINIELKLI